MSSPTVLMPVFDVQAVLTKMLTNQALLHEDHLSPGYDIFTGQSSLTSVDGADCGYYDEIYTGDRWQPAVQHYCDATKNEIPCGLVVFYDKSHADRHGSLCVSPIMFTLTFFNKTARANSRFWDILAYVPNLDSSKESANKQALSALKCQNEHNCLYAALRQLKDVNESGGIPMRLQQRDVRVKVWIHIVVGDINGNNVLLGSYNSAQGSCPYRDCSCSLDDFIDPHSMCQFIHKSDIDKMKTTNDRKALQAASKHNIVNAFDTIPTGDPTNTIYRSTPPETMHAISAGIVKRMLENLGDGFERGKAVSMMQTVHLLLAKQHSWQSERGLPRPSTRNQVSTTSKTQASEMTGNIFLFMCALHTKLGQHMCALAGISEFDRKGKIETIKKILALEKWLNRRNKKSDVDDPTKIQSYIRHDIIPLLQKYFPRTDGMGWKFPKVHSLTKFPSFIRAFGSAINFFGGFGESNLKYYMKQYAHFTQRRPEKFAPQLAQNHYITSLFDHSSYCIRMQTKSNFVLMGNSNERKFEGQHRLTFTRSSGSSNRNVGYSTSVQWRTPKSARPVDDTLRYTIGHYMSQADATAHQFQVTAYTTATLPNNMENIEAYDAGESQSIYRVNTKENRRDWCMIQTHALGSDTDDERLDTWAYVCPARIHGFVRFETPGIPTPCLLQQHDNATTIKQRRLIDDTMYVIVRTHDNFLTWTELEKGFVVHVQLGKLDECTYILPVSRIVNPLYVFEDHRPPADTPNLSFFAALPSRYWGFYLDYKLNPNLITGHSGLSQKCNQHTE